MKEIKPLRRSALMVKVLRLLGGMIEFSRYPQHSHKETHVGIPVNSFTSYSQITNVELKKAQALIHWREMIDKPK